jgi:F-type H+-transporting ATPase subunit b
MQKLILLINLLVASAVFASEEGQGAAKQDVFSGTLADSIWTVITFLVLLVILGKFAWKPLIKSLKDREEHIKNEIDAAENARQQAEKLIDDYKQKGLVIIEEATKSAQQSQRELMEETQQETTLIRQRARDDIQHALTYASEKLWGQAADMIEQVGKEVLGRAVSSDDNKRLIQEAVEKIRTSHVETGK